MNRNFILPILAGVLILAIAGFGFFDSSNIALLSPAGPVALAERSVIFLTVLLCAIVVIPVFFMLFYFAWKYRASSYEAKVEHNAEWDHYDTLAELVWWFVPSVIIGALAVVAWQSSHALDPYKPLSGTMAPITVEVVALDWKWLFFYPAYGIATVNELEIPAGTPIHFYVTADAPMNSLWIPKLGGQIMAMPGMTTQLNLMADNPGEYEGLSGNLSGEGFAGMTFAVHSVSQAAFADWVQAAQNAHNPLTLSGYQTLLLPSQNNAPTIYAPANPSLYTDIVIKYMSSSDQQSAQQTIPMQMSEGMTMP